MDNVVARIWKFGAQNMYFSDGHLWKLCVRAGCPKPPHGCLNGTHKLSVPKATPADLQGHFITVMQEPFLCVLSRVLDICRVEVAQHVIV